MTADRSLLEARQTLVRRRDELDDAIRALDRVIGDHDAAGAPAEMNRSPVRHRAGRGARADATEAIIIEAGDGGVSPEELATAFEARGMPLRSATPGRAARAAGNRARDKNPQIKLEAGRFVYRPETSGPQPAASGVPEDNAGPGEV